MDFLLSLILLTSSYDAGRLSHYAPKDGHNRGVLACGGSFSKKQEHIAYRAWKQVGCGRPVLICAEDTFSCSLTKVRDAGPFGVTKGKSWRVHVGVNPPRGWKFRAAADISNGLWRRLGKPKHLSRIYLVFLPDILKGWLRRVERTFFTA